MAAAGRRSMCISLIQESRRLGASDLHMTVGGAPMVRLDGYLQQLVSTPVTAAQLAEFVALLPDYTRQLLERRGEVDCAWRWGNERYRLNIYRQRDQYAMAVRLLNNVVPECEALGMPPALQAVTELSQGLVLIVGPTGSGKTTTLAALVQRINATRAVHIVTLEDPIEYEYPAGQSLIHQREIGRDTTSFARGLRAALREDPDVILVGELRDSETMAIALTAAETGHLVLATLHTQDVTSSVNRIVDGLQQNQQLVRSQLAESLAVVASQRLLARADGQGRVAAYEVLVATDAVRHLIREGQVHQLQSYLQTGARNGMVTMEESVKSLRRTGIIK